MQLSNVSFGGAWSEQIAADEALAFATTRVDSAVIDTLSEDLRGDAELDAALALVAASHPKGAMLARAWQKGLLVGNANLRSQELKRVAIALRTGIGERLGRY
ncbi:hypothetical protein ACEUZ9_000478 [Paracoccus litorisediminis]|uniref:hypothetical protein n=1 Tax=Paracoccus litorisediminis TaxID=2006130 RepID=UPI00373490F5